MPTFQGMKQAIQDLYFGNKNQSAFIICDGEVLEVNWQPCQNLKAKYLFIFLNNNIAYWIFFFIQASFYSTNYANQQGT